MSDRIKLIEPNEVVQRAHASRIIDALEHADRIIIVEDNELYRIQLLRAIRKLTGREPVVAYSLEEARELMAGDITHSTVVLSDNNFPEMRNGYGPGLHGHIVYEMVDNRTGHFALTTSVEGLAPEQMHLKEMLIKKQLFLNMLKEAAIQNVPVQKPQPRLFGEALGPVGLGARVAAEKLVKLRRF